MTADNRYFSNLAAALNSSNGDVAADLLSHTGAHVAPFTTRTSDLASASCQRLLYGVAQRYSQVVENHVCSAVFANQGLLQEAFTAQLEACVAFRQIWTAEREQPWMLPVLAVLVRDLRRLASSSDDLSSRTGGKPEALDKAMGETRSCFALANQDRSDAPASKKHALVFLANNLFALSFKQNNFANIKSVLQSMNLPQNSVFVQNARKADAVLYQFNVGRNAIFSDQFKDAETALSLSFMHCLAGAGGNKRRILIHLAPVRMLLGYLPTQALLAKYSLHEYQELVVAVRLGHVLRLRVALQRHQSTFIQWGVYLILEKLVFVTYCSLLRRVHAIMGGVTNMRLPPLLAVLHSLGEGDVDAAELECIVANLLQRKWIRGNLQTSQKSGETVLVLAPKNPFVQMSTVPVVF